MHTLFASSIFCIFLFLPGCTLMELDRQNKEAEQRINGKVQELRDLQNQQKVLLGEQKRLLQEKNSQQMTLDELDAKLDEARRENTRIAKTTTEQQKQKENIELQLQRYQKEIADLRKDDLSSDKAKKEKIEDLRKKIDEYLKLMLGL
jgi:hypothetical protein